MAKYCIGCGNRCADNDSHCSRCGMALNTQRVQHNDYKSMTGEIRNQQIGDLDTDKVDASGHIPIQRKNNSKKIMMIVAVVLVVVVGVFCYPYIKNIIPSYGFKNIKYIQDDIKSEELHYTLESITSFKIIKNEREDSDIRKVSIAVESEGINYSASREFKTVYVKSKPTKGGWFLKSLEKTKEIYSVKQPLTKEFIKSDLTGPDEIKVYDSNELNGITHNRFDEIKDIKMNVIRDQIDELKVKDQKELEDSEDIYDDSSDEDGRDESNAICTEVTAKGVKYSDDQDSWQWEYSLKILYVLDTNSDTWIPDSIEQEDISDYNSDY